MKRRIKSKIHPMNDPTMHDIQSFCSQRKKTLHHKRLSSHLVNLYSVLLSMLVPITFRYYYSFDFSSFKKFNNQIQVMENISYSSQINIVQWLNNNYIIMSLFVIRLIVPSKYRYLNVAYW